MPEARSPLAGFYRPGRTGAADGAPGVGIAEVRGLDLVQVVGWPDGFDGVSAAVSEAVACPPPPDYRTAAVAGPVTIFMTGPERLLIVAPESHGLHDKLAGRLPADQAAVTGLGHGRAVLRLSGPAARDVLVKGLPVDIDDSVFPAGAFAQSMLEEVAALVHRRPDEGGQPVFDIYVTRSLAHIVFAWLQEAAAEFGCAVGEPL